MKPVNIKEFQELVKRYETITLDEIIEKWDIDVAELLTGHGSNTTCTLCIAVNRGGDNSVCFNCVYQMPLGCNSDFNADTYFKIHEARTPEELLLAYRARAEHLRKTYPQYL